MDRFLDPFWNLDQIRGWACSRDPEVVRFAADGLRGALNRPSSSIDVRTAYAAEKAKQAGRDVNLELWNASGWPLPENAFVAPASMEQFADELGVPVFQIYRDASTEVQPPRCEPTEALLEAYARASEFEQNIFVSLVKDSHPSEESNWLERPAYGALSPEMQQLLARYVNRKAVHGPYRVLRHAPFPIEDYLLQLCRRGVLIAHGNLSEHPVARTLTSADWGGLEIAVGGEQRRLSVWRIGRVANSGKGDFENVPVERDAVLREFPAEIPPPQRLPIAATDDAARAVIRQALNDSEGFVGQEKGAEIVRDAIPGFPKKRAMQLVKELTGNDKPGPKGPRRNRADNRAR
jgi:hypothetical protein